MGFSDQHAAAPDEEPRMCQARLNPSLKAENLPADRKAPTESHQPKSSDGTSTARTSAASEAYMHCEDGFAVTSSRPLPTFSS